LIFLIFLLKPRNILIVILEKHAVIHCYTKIAILLLNVTKNKLISLIYVTLKQTQDCW